MSADDVAIRDATTADWPDIRSIYQQGIDSGDATFEEAAPPQDEWEARFIAGSRLVATRATRVVAWAALSRVSSRSAYRGVAETSVYVDAGERARGTGLRILADLVARSEELGFWTLQAGIFPENAASIRIHEKCGFRIVGRRERIGCQHGRWRDVVLMERRSDKA